MKRTAEEKIDHMFDDIGVTRREFNARGVYKNPGRFEGCTIQDLWFYDSMLNGSGEMLDDDGAFTAVEIDKEDREVFPNIDKKTTHAIVILTDNGFLRVSYNTRKMTNDLRNSLNANEG